MGAYQKTVSSHYTSKDDSPLYVPEVYPPIDLDDNGNPLYPENSLVLTVDTTVGDGTYTATVNVKQGIFGALDDAIEEILEPNGNIDISIDNTQSRIRELEKKIISEEDRLERVEERLVLRFARLEKVLTDMQQQMNAVNMLTQAVFGSL